MLRRLPLGLLMAAVLAASCSQSPSKERADSLDRIRNDKVLRVGYIVFPPCITKEAATGKLGGHFAATIEEIARQAEWRVEFVESDWSTFTAGLAAERFDLSIAPTFVTVPRALSVSFTRPIFFAGNSAIVRKGETRFTDVRSLDRPGVTIAVTQGEAGHEFARANFKQAKLIVHTGADQMLTFQEVLAGRADAALGDAYVTAQFAKLHPEVSDLFAANPYNLTPVSWALRPGESTLLSFLNASLEALESQGKLLEFEEAAGAHWLHVRREWVTF